MELGLVPETLRGALWFQFARTIAGNKHHFQCAYCERWIELAPGTMRRSRRFCSDACRVKAYRQRQERAKG